MRKKVGCDILFNDLLGPWLAILDLLRGFVNGMSSLIDFGLNDWDEGFGEREYNPGKLQLGLPPRVRRVWRIRFF